MPKRCECKLLRCMLAEKPKSTLKNLENDLKEFLTNLRRKEKRRQKVSKYRKGKKHVKSIVVSNEPNPLKTSFTGSTVALKGDSDDEEHQGVWEKTKNLISDLTS